MTEPRSSSAFTPRVPTNAVTNPDPVTVVRAFDDMMNMDMNDHCRHRSGPLRVTPAPLRTARC
jgi:hypothetical protein